MAKIVIVDDDQDIREAIMIDLDDNCFTLFEAENGKDALDFLENNQVDYVITDLIMPEEDGLSLIPKIKERYPQIEVIAVSGESRYGTSSYLKTAMAFGASHTIQKPFNSGVFTQYFQKHAA